jgi:hypothetical protein
MGAACSIQGDIINAYKVLIGKTEAKRLVERSSVNQRIILK